MKLRDFFVPDWKHSDPKIRLKSLKELSDVMVLRQLVENDQDERVREAALEKINDEKIYRELAQKTKGQDPNTYKMVSKKLSKICYDQLVVALQWGEVEKRLLHGVEDEEMLAKLVRDAKGQEVRLEALICLKNDKICFNLAMDASNQDLATALVDKINDEHYLKRLVRESQVKRVRKQAEEKLKKSYSKDHQSMPEVQKKEIEELLSQMKEIQQKAEWTASEKANFQALCDSFDQRQFDPKITLYQVFNKLRLELEENFNAYYFSFSKINNLIEQAKNLDSTKGSEAEKELRKIEDEYKKTGKARLSERERDDFDSQFERACKKFSARLYEHRGALEKQQKSFQVLRKLVDEVEDIERNLFAMLKKQSESEIAHLLEKMQREFKEYHFEDEKLNRFRDRFEGMLENLQKKIGEVQSSNTEREQEASKLEAIIAKLKESHKLENFKERHKIVGDLVEEWKSLGLVAKETKRKLQDQFHKECDLFYKELQERRQNQDWESWINLKQKKELVEAAKEIVSRSDLDSMAREINELKDKWKKIGPVPKSESDELWSQFFGLCQQGYDRCLVQKQTIMQELKDLLAPLEKIEGEDVKALADKMNLKEVSNQIKALQQKWNDLGILPKKLEGDLYESFRKTVDNFFDKRKAFFEAQDQDRQGNLVEKRQVLREAEKLMSTQDSMEEKARELRNLQKRWREIGPLPHQEGQDLWDKFHHVCNEFFASFDKFKEENLQKREEIIGEVEALLASLPEDANLSETQSKFDELKERYEEIPPTFPEKTESLWKRFNGPMDAFLKRRKQQMKEASLEQEKATFAKVRLLRQIEDLSVNLPDLSEAENLISEVKDAWSKLPQALAPKEEAEYQKRLQQLVDLYDLEKRQYDRMSDEERRHNLGEAEKSLLHLHVLAQLAFPDSMKDLRIYKSNPEQNQEDMGQQLNLALKYKSKASSLPELRREARHFSEALEKLGPVPQEFKRAVCDHHRRLVDILFF